jgi:hypothetical protein
MCVLSLKCRSYECSRRLICGLVEYGVVDLSEQLANETEYGSDYEYRFLLTSVCVCVCAYVVV